MTPLSQISSGIAPTPPAASEAEVSKAAKEFETIFVRQMLASLEKTAGQGSEGGIYGSMVVDSLSSAIAEAGGLGLAEEIARALETARPIKK